MPARRGGNGRGAGETAGGDARPLGEVHDPAAAEIRRLREELRQRDAATSEERRQQHEATNAALARIEAKLAEPGPRDTPKHKGGRPRLYAWDLFYIEAFRLATLDGFETRDELGGKMRAWVHKTYENPPSDRAIAEKVSQLARAIDL